MVSHLFTVANWSDTLYVNITSSRYFSNLLDYLQTATIVILFSLSGTIIATSFAPLLIVDSHSSYTTQQRKDVCPCQVWPSNPSDYEGMDPKRGQSNLPITIGGRGYESITCCLVRNNRLTAKPAVQLALNHRSPYSTAQGQSGTH